jgi:hypothetical protein
VTTVFDRTDGVGQTHALVIGVGRYRHLSGGVRPADDPIARRLGQLASPATSALAVARFLLREQVADPEAPLGSVELAVSPAGPVDTVSELEVDGERVPVEPATFSRVRDAVDRWFARCQRHAGNVAFLYVSGHGVGVAREHVTLLLEDFAERPQELFANAVDVDGLRLGMAACRASTQCFFVDACRSVPDELLERLEVRAPSLLDGWHHRPRPDALTVYATGHDEQAFGRSGGLTRYADALLRALRGLGARREKGAWRVTTDHVGLAVAEVLRHGNEIPGTPVQCADVVGGGRGSVLRVLSGIPAVPFRLGCDPAAATDAATMRLVGLWDGRVADQRDGGTGDWLGEVAAGAYDFQVRFPGREFRDGRLEVAAHPPWLDDLLPVDSP